MLKNFAQNVFKWHYFDQVSSRFTRDGKMAFFTSQTTPLRRETSQRRQPEVFLAVISLPLAVTGVCRRRILSRLINPFENKVFSNSYFVLKLNYDSGAPTRATEPHTHRLWSTSFPLVVTWLTEHTYVRVYGLYGWGRGDYQKEGRGVSGVSC